MEKKWVNIGLYHAWNLLDCSLDYHHRDIKLVGPAAGYTLSITGGCIFSACFEVRNALSEVVWLCDNNNNLT